MSAKKQFVQPTAKGQVTLPVRIRRELAITADTLLDVSVRNGQIVLEPLRTQEAATERWETVADFTETSPKGVDLTTLQRRVRTWTQSTKPSAS